MKTKTLLLASSALAMLAMAEQAQASSLYVSVFGGANWQKDESGATLTSDWGGEGTSDLLGFNSNVDTGFVIGAAVGTHLDKWVKGLRGELEVSYRRNDVHGDWFAIIDNGRYTDSGLIDANNSTFAVTANLWYDIDCGWKVIPYVGGGVGWGRAHADGAFISTDGSNTSTSWDFHVSGFVYQLGAGLNYPVAPGVQVGVGYRFFNGPNLDIFFGNKSSLRLDNDSHSVMANITVDID